MSETPNRVRELRSVIFKGQVSQKELAERAGIDPSTLSDIETQKTNPSALTALAVARVLGVTVEDLFVPPSTDEPSVDLPAGEALVGRLASPDASAPDAALDELPARSGPPSASPVDKSSAEPEPVR